MATLLRIPISTSNQSFCLLQATIQQSGSDLKGQYVLRWAHFHHSLGWACALLGSDWARADAFTSVIWTKFKSEILRRFHSKHVICLQYVQSV